MPEDLIVRGTPVPAGAVRRVEIPVARLATRTMLHLPVTVFHGAREGPRVWINAAIHGDEINGVEIVRRVCEKLRPERMRGTLLAVPVVNLFGFIEQNRYLPDGRDLNRSFPGSRGGSLAAQLAHLFLREVVDRCSAGVDLHTGARDRTNLPQIRADLDDQDTRRLARVFGARAMVHARLRDGSLRQAAKERGASILVYEGGEARRFNEEVIRTGVRGVLRILADLGIRPKGPAPARRPPQEIRKSRWVRALRSGILRLSVQPGDLVEKNQGLGEITDIHGEHEAPVKAPARGLVLGLTRSPLISKGDAILNVGLVPSSKTQEENPT